MTYKFEDCPGELAFLRFFYKTACEWYSNGGTDEAQWIAEMYEEETGEAVPSLYNEYDD